MKRKIRRWGLLLLAALFLAAGADGSAKAEVVHKDYSIEELYQVIDGIIGWKKESSGADESGNLLTDTYLKDAGQSEGDWYPMCLGRLGLADDYASYLAVTEQRVCERYQTEDKLDAVKATEWHRISLAILASGGDPADVGEEHINLIADGVYDRGRTAELGAQGINGVIWGLTALDSLRYRVPEDAFYTRSDIIQMLLESQLADGGFAFGGVAADADITGMALTALAPYYNSEETYTYTQEATGETVTKTVRQVAEESLQCLSAMQAEDGNFTSWNMENSESISQIIMALSSLGIDAAQDERFIKDGVTLLDVLMDFRMSDGGFLHSHEYDEENKDADPKESNTMASEQALYALIAYVRNREGLRNFYDFRQEMTEECREQIQQTDSAIAGIGEKDAAQVKSVYAQYKKIPVEERCYVRNYKELAERMEALNIPNDSEYLAGAMEQSEGGKTTITNIRNRSETISTEVTFSEQDKEEAQAIPEEATLEYEIPVLKAIYRIEKSGSGEKNAELLADLKEKRKAVAERKREIDRINADMKEKLYPFEDIDIGDKDTVDGIMERYEKLSEYEKTQIAGYEDVEKAYIQISNLIRMRMIGGAAAAAAILLLLILFVRARKRKKEKRSRKMLDWEEDDDEE